MNSVMVILCVGSVLSRVLMSCFATETLLKVFIIYIIRLVFKYETHKRNVTILCYP